MNFYFEKEKILPVVEIYAPRAKRWRGEAFYLEIQEYFFRSGAKHIKNNWSILFDLL